MHYINLQSPHKNCLKKKAARLNLNSNRYLLASKEQKNVIVIENLLENTKNVVFMYLKRS